MSGNVLSAVGAKISAALLLQVMNAVVDVDFRPTHDFCGTAAAASYAQQSDRRPHDHC